MHFFPTGSASIQESSQIIEPNIPESQQTIATIENSPSTKSPSAPIQLPPPVSQGLMSADKTQQAPESAQEHPLQEENTLGK
jgi:hypothetical protein